MGETHSPEIPHLEVLVTAITWSTKECGRGPVGPGGTGQGRLPGGGGVHTELLVNIQFGRENMVRTVTTCLGVLGIQSLLLCHLPKGHLYLPSDSSILPTLTLTLLPLILLHFSALSPFALMSISLIVCFLPVSLH